MKKKVVWLVVTGWMVAALLLASCAPAVTEKEKEKVAPPPEKKEEVVAPKEVVVPKEEANLVKWTGKKLDGTVVEIMKEKPRYGGTYIDFYDRNVLGFEDATGLVSSAIMDDPTSEQLIAHDWARGLSGTGEWGALAAPFADIFGPMGLAHGILATGWQVLPGKDADTAILPIRRGVHFALDPTSEASRLVGGREVTADDVVYTLRRQWSQGFGSRSYGDTLIDHKNLANSIYVSPDDPWAVVLKAKPGQVSLPLTIAVGAFSSILPRDAMEKYGERTVSNWKSVVGTGPFMLRDYVGASSITWVRNPSYWMRDPFFPENQLPYIDTLKVLIIPDVSTRMAAIRTGKIDRLYNVAWDDARSLMKTNPELKWHEYVSGRPPNMRFNNAEKPFNDIRVRQALMMAINYQEVTNTYYEGKAALFGYPVSFMPQFMYLYKPVEKMPQSVQELYGYHPDKAQQLLAGAGYPQGFKTDILTTVEYVDLLSVIKEYWAKIGVDLKIDVREPGVMSALGRTYKQMIMGTTDQASLVWKLNTEADIDPTTNDNINSPVAKAIRWELAVTENYYVPGKKEEILMSPLSQVLPGVPEAQTDKNWPTYANEQVWRIFLPEPYLYNFWQPWVKGYDGTFTSGHFDNRLGIARYLWIDQELKKAMGR